MGSYGRGLSCFSATSSFTMFFNYVSCVRLAFCSAHYQSSFTSHFTQTGTLRPGQSPSLQLQIFFMLPSFFSVADQLVLLAACSYCLVMWVAWYIAACCTLVKNIKWRGWKTWCHFVLTAFLAVERAVWPVITMLNGDCLSGNFCAFSCDNSLIVACGFALLLQKNLPPCKAKTEIELREYNYKHRNSDFGFNC